MSESSIDAKENYRASIEYAPDKADDPLPWIGRVYSRNPDGTPGDYIGSKWRGTRDEAIESVYEIISAYEQRGVEEWIL